MDKQSPDFDLGLQSCARWQPWLGWSCAHWNNSVSLAGATFAGLWIMVGVHQFISSDIKEFPAKNWCKISDILRFKFTSEMSAYRWFLNRPSGNALCASCTVFFFQDLPAAQQTSVDVQPTRTRYTFQAWQCSDIVCLVSERALWYLMRHDGDDDDHCHQYHHTAWCSTIHRCPSYIVIHDGASWCSVVRVTS